MIPITMSEERTKLASSPCSLFCGDCLDVMTDIEDGSVDMVMTDPPYGTTACKWDSIIPLEPMWEHLKRVIKPNGAVVMTASQPFTTTLIASNMKMFKHELIWDKCVGGAFVLAKKRVLPAHENILLFSDKLATYNPQMTVKPIKDRRPMRPDSRCTNQSIKTAGGVRKQSANYDEKLKYPTSILSYPKQMQECNNTKRLHPTQKPVALMEYLIKTYTNEGETVLDFTMGSGTTGVACKNLNRSFVGIEMDEKYFEIAKQRISEANKEIGQRDSD